MVVGNVTALLQEDLKRLLAYSSIGHVGYMLVGLAVGTQIGVTGTFLHIFNHALMKGAAFLCAGAIIYRLESRELRDMVGIGRKMPVTAIVLAISSFALIGMPPLNGFISELILFTATVQANLAWLGVAIILNSALSAAYYLRIIRTLMQAGGSEKIEKVKEAPLVMLMPLCVLAVLIVLFGVWPDQLIRIAQQAAAALLSMSG
jgi:formate hydrogenlyase subunit 3/multisubunit Na+/H+ antiporter MnhD subunit